MTDAQEILALLETETAIAWPLPGGGHIQIERPRPFICIYRAMPGEGDAGTRNLVTSQTSYVILPYDTADRDTAVELLADIVNYLAVTFGAVLVVEIFATPLEPDYVPEDGPPNPAFDILAPRRRAPAETIEALERALLEQSWPGGEPTIGIAYKQHCAPHDSAPLIPSTLRKRSDVIEMALGVRTIYREPERGAVLPTILRDVRRALTTALRQCFYAFSHSHAGHRPAHYHELGAQVIEQVAWDVDRSLAEVGDCIDLVLDATPVNNRAAWSEFRSSRFQNAPEFHYRPLRHDPGSLKRRLYEVHLERVEDPALHALFTEKREELDRQINLLGDRGTKHFLYGSLQIYGAPDEPLLALARSLASSISPRSRESSRSKSLDAAAFARIAEQAISYYRKHCPTLKAKVEIRDDVPGLIVSNGHLLVGRNATVSAARVEATIAHEVGTHILTYYNGLAQPFQQLHAGMAGYEALQEGMAVLAEYLVNGLSKPRMRLLAGRVLAVGALVDSADFVETVDMLHSDLGFSNREAYSIAMRVHRSGGLTKDMIYLKGLVELLDYLGNSDAPYEDLLVGKFALNHVNLLDELRWRNILREPVLVPRYLEDPSVRKRLDSVRQGLHPLDLIKRRSS